MRTIATLAACALLSLGAPGPLAGVHFESRTVVEGEKKSQSSTMESEIWVEGDNARIEIRETEGAATNPLMKEGSFLVTHDGGKTILLVDPKEKTAMEFDVEAMMESLGGLLASVNDMGIVNTTFSNPQFEVLEEGSGEPLFGMPTNYAKTKATYVLETKVLGMTRRTETETISEIWSSDKAPSPAVWFTRPNLRTGDKALDDMMRAEHEKLERFGLPLQSTEVTHTRTYNKKGKLKDESTSTRRTELVSWSEEDVDDGLFVVGPEYERVPAPSLEQLAADGESGDEPEEKKGLGKKLGGFFKRKK